MAGVRRFSLTSSLLLLLFILIVVGDFTPRLIPTVMAHGSDSGSSAATGANDQHKDLRKDTNLVAVKLWCLAIVFSATFLGGMSPFFCRWNHNFLLLGTQFAGGVFLATALLHFLSDSNKTFQDNSTIDYPFAFMLAAAGYLLTMLGDCLIHWIFTKDQGTSSSTAGDDVELVRSQASAITPLGVATACDIGHQPNPSWGSSKHEVAINVNAEAKFFLSATMLKNASFSDTLLLIVALCFHSVFEGIAIGIAENAKDAWRALWTISLHKVFAAIAMGLALLSMLPNRPLLSCMIFSFAFAISSPIGVAIGILIDATAQGAIADWIYAITMGVACGVFIYISINHLLAKCFFLHEKLKVDTPFFKFLAATLGVGVICVVMAWDT